MKIKYIISGSNGVVEYAETAAQCAIHIGAPGETYLYNAFKSSTHTQITYRNSTTGVVYTISRPVQRMDDKKVYCDEQGNLYHKKVGLLPVQIKQIICTVDQLPSNTFSRNEISVNNLALSQTSRKRVLEPSESVKSIDKKQRVNSPLVDAAIARTITALSNESLFPSGGGQESEFDFSKRAEFESGQQEERYFGGFGWSQ